MGRAIKEKFYGEHYILGYDAEWCQDDQLDFVIEISSDMLLDPKFGFNIDEVYMDSYNETDLGVFWCTDSNQGKFTWLWAIASPYHPITEKTRRKHIGSFHLFDTETCSTMPNTKAWKEFKKGITPMIDAMMVNYLKSLC